MSSYLLDTTLVRLWYHYFEIAAGCGCSHGGNDLIEVQFHNRPLRSAQHDKGYSALRGSADGECFYQP